MDQSAWKQFILDFEKSNNAPVLVPLLKKASFVSYKNDILSITCENLGMRIFLESRKDEMESYFKDVYSKQLTITFVIKEKTNKKQQEEVPLLRYENSLLDILRKSGLQPKYTLIILQFQQQTK